MKKIKVVLASLIIIMVVLTGCSTTTETKKMRIGVMPDVGAVPFVIAEQQGYFEEKDIEVEIVVFRSALDRDTALQTGNLDAVMADMLTIIFFNEAEFDVKMTSQTDGAYKMVSSSKLDNDAFNNLDKISIGLSSNTVIDYTTQKIAQALDFENQLEKVAIPQMPVRLEMLRAGELSGATLPDPLAAAAVEEGGVIIGSTDDFNLYPGIFMITDTYLQSNQEVVQKMYAAYNESIEYINETDVDEYYDFLVEKLGYPVTLKGKFEMPMLNLAKAPDENTFEDTLEWMTVMGLAEESFNYDDLIDLSVLPQ